ncbi:T9SS type A sorting domain-containing protein [Mangrovimonas sp. TPBH4]|uniref:T9SS type A sorting domain-containing protein n=1 Tax=Mangrovimonas sp. TPBH4 TaxID=1645914 RepID=UPI0006B4DFE6|nr:T9SS type A sorting domain-containing protein [Mangrovimonas sp. TPBH4]
MKKIYFLVFTLTTMLSFGQDMVISGVFDGPLSGGLPKVVELYVINDVADLSLYGFGSANNGDGTDDAEITLSGSATAGEYLYIASDDTSVMDYFGITPDFVSDAANVNGDDALELFFNSSVIDTFGDINVDGTGEAWEYLDGWAYRVDGTGPDGSTFVLANWSYSGPDAIDGCTSNDTCGSEFPMGTYSTEGSTEPSLTILSPSNGEEFIPGTSSVTLSISVQNFVVGNPGEGIDGHIHWSIVSGEGAVTQPMKYDTDDIEITVTDGGEYLVEMYLADNNHNPITPEVSASVEFEVEEIIQVENLAALRADVTTNGEGHYYELLSTPTVTYTRTFRNQKYIQDASAGILIDDNSGIITTSFVENDGIDGLIGQTTEYNGVLQFVPMEDASVSTGTAVTPEVVSIATLLTDWEDYESELIEIVDATFTDAGSTFASASNYDLSDGSTINFRTNFSEADYIGTTIPTGAVPVVALVNEYNGSPQITSRSLMDMTLSIGQFESIEFSLHPNPTNSGIVTISTANQGDISVTVYDVLGKNVLNTDVLNGQLNVSTLAPGLYLLQLEQNNASVTKKLIIN